MPWGLLSAVLWIAQVSALRLHEPSPDKVVLNLPRRFVNLFGEESDRDAAVLARSPLSTFDPCGTCEAHAMLSERGDDTLRRLGRCALVGSSQLMAGSGNGKQIDSASFDTVIRVNRLPNESFFEDFGSRTDVLFTGPIQHGKSVFNTEGILYTFLGGEVRLCRYNDTACPFRAVILKGADTAEVGQEFSERYPRDRPGWLPSASNFPVARQSEEINTLAWRLLGLERGGRAENSRRPSNGFHALLWAAAACDRLSIFGFNGPNTVDHHRITKHHSLKLEHQLIWDLLRSDLASNLTRELPLCAPCLNEKTRHKQIQQIFNLPNRSYMMR